MIKKVITYCVFVVSVFCQGLGQDIHFSQIDINPVLLNPAYSGFFEGKGRFGMVYRNQWASVSDPYQTYAFTAEWNAYRRRYYGDGINIGLSLARDESGTLDYGTTKVDAIVSYFRRLNKSNNHFVSAGLSVGFGQQSFNSLNIILPEASETFDEVKTKYPDLGFGLAWFYNPTDNFTIKDMNLLAKSDVFAENKLFATLDTTVRKVVIENVPFLLSDTVGFIRKLPHQLVEAFKSTLDEVREADILMHVVDISHPNFEDHIRVVEETLKDIKAIDKPIFVVFNKIDAYRYEEYDEFSLEPKKQVNYTLDEFKNSWIAKENTPCIFISAREKIGIDKLRGDLYKMVAEIHAGRYPFDNFLW